MADDTIIDRADRAGSASKRNFELLPGTRFRPEPIRWLWPQWLARGKLQLLAGSAGTGKTTISVALAAAVTTGAAWPDDGRSEVGDVLFWSGEDGIADTLVPRFLAAGGDLSRLHFAGEVTEGRRRRTFDPAEDLPKLIAAVREMPNLRLMVLDPVVSTRRTSLAKPSPEDKSWPRSRGAPTTASRSPARSTASPSRSSRKRGSPWAGR